jgi:hypothetical protein
MGDAGKYILNIGYESDQNATTERFHTIAELQDRLRALEKGPPVKFDVVQDLGPQKSWLKRLFGIKRDTLHLFAIEWYEGYARLTFYDEAVSEYWAIDHEHPTNPSTEVRMKLSFLEPTPAPADEIMEAARGFEAIRQFLDRATRPEWLSYRYVK